MQAYNAESNVRKLRLTEDIISAATPRERPYRLTDGHGLHLVVAPTGARYWRMRYEFHGRENTLSFGLHPHVSLADARLLSDRAHAEMKARRDPSVWLKARRVAEEPTDERFERYARDWFATNRSAWSERHAADVIRSLERDVFPQIGSMQVQDIKAPHLLKLLRKIEARPAVETAHRARQRIAMVLDFAYGMGAVEANPAIRVAKALKPIRHRHLPAALTLDEAREALAAAEATPAYPVTKLALRLLALTAVRPGVIAATPWTDFSNLSTGVPTWRVPVSRMKLRAHQKDDPARDHLVPLPRQAIEVIETLRRLTGRGPMVFPNTRFPLRAMSENAMGYLLNRAGLKGHHVPHGWRATFSTVMHERHVNQHEIIELILAHVPENHVAAAYNRARHLDRRRELLQEWADLLLEGMPSAGSLVNGRRKR